MAKVQSTFFVEKMPQTINFAFLYIVIIEISFLYIAMSLIQKYKYFIILVKLCYLRLLNQLTLATPRQPLQNIFAVNREAKNRLNHTYTKDLDFYVIINSFFFGLKNAGKLNSLTCMNSLNLIKLFPRIILTTYPFWRWLVLYQMFSLKMNYKGIKKEIF